VLEELREGNELDEFIALIEEAKEEPDAESEHNSRATTLIELIKWCDEQGLCRDATRSILDRASGNTFIIR
jgi:hypothetical protein